MASIYRVGKTWHCAVSLWGRAYKRSLRTSDPHQAEQMSVEVEAAKSRLTLGQDTVPPGVSVSDYLFSGGRCAGGRGGRLLLWSTFEEFFAAQSVGALEGRTVEGMKLHSRRLAEHFGRRYDLSALDRPSLQEYVNSRSRATGQRGGKITRTTIVHELSTLRALWKWCKAAGRVSAPWPGTGLVYPKGKMMPPFQTIAEIRPQLAGLSSADQAALWASVYLTVQEVGQLLDDIRKSRGVCCSLAMVATAAHTGMRRAELCRATRGDLKDDSIVVQERKRVRGRHSVRRVPLSGQLRGILDEWLEQHPGGDHLFCRVVDRPLNSNAARHQWEYAIANTEWDCLPGFHCLRHSFISNLAADGVDQRLIDDMVGHTTEEMRRRYRHLFPHVAQQAIRSVFD